MDRELPSEKDAIKKGFLRNLTHIKLIIDKVIITTVIEKIKNINHLTFTDVAIPMVIAPKYTESSRGDLTGFLKRTIDNAPTIPNDNAIFPEITLVITYVITGKIRSVEV